MGDFLKSIDAATQLLIQQELATAIPEGKRGALFVVADTHGATLQVAGKLATGWKIAGGAGVTWHGDVTGRVMVMGSW